jgi:hypothetical protein
MAALRNGRGGADRAWADEAHAPLARRIKVERESRYIAMSDGGQLAVDVYRSGRAATKSR